MVMVFSKLMRRNSPKKNGDDNMEMEEYQTRIELLSEIAEEASSITEVSTLLERILKVTQHTLGTTVTTLFFNDCKNNELHSPFSVRHFSDSPHRRATAVEMAVARWVAGNVIPIMVNNIEADARFQQKDDDTPGSAARSIIAAPILRGKKVIGVISSIDKENGDDFTERDFEVIKGFATTEALILLVSMQITAIENFSRLALDQALLEGYRSTAEELATTADIQDSFGYAHSRRCKEYALLAANCLNLPPREIKNIEFGALLHDIGKIGIDSDVLCKPGPLTDEEWSLMYEHPRKGADILDDISYLKDARDIVLYHHEWYDGTGYPEKLKGEDIPLGARIVAVANAFDSMTTEHSYRAAFSVDEAITELVNGIGTQFCPRATEAFISAFRKHEGQLPFQRNHEDLKAEVEKEVEEITDQTAKDDMNMTIEEEREARREQARAEQEAREQREKAEKEAEKQREKDEKEARKQQVKAEKEAQKQRENDEKEARKQQVKAEKEAEKQLAKAEEAAKEQQSQSEMKVAEQKVGAEKDIKESQPADEEEVKEQLIIEKIEARRQQARMEEESERSRKPVSVRPASGGGMDAEMFHGDVRLVLPGTDDTVRVRKFRKELQKIEGLTIVMFGSSEEDGHMFVLSLAEPMALINAVRAIPLVENIEKKGKNIEVTLKNDDS